MSLSVPLLFAPRGQTFLKHRRRGEQTFLHVRNISRLKGGTNNFALKGGGKHLFTEAGGKRIFTLRGGGQSFYVGDGVRNNDVHGWEEEDVSRANFLVIKVRKLSVGARIFGGP